MRESNKTEIQSMDTPNLTKMRNIIRDKWTWETGTDEDKEFLDFIESELDSRESASLSPEPYFNVTGESLEFNNSELVRKSYNYSHPIELGDDLSKAVKKTITECLNSYNYESHEIDVSGAVLKKINEEIEGELKSKLEMLIRNVVNGELSYFESRMTSMMEEKIEEMKVNSITNGEL